MSRSLAVKSVAAALALAGAAVAWGATYATWFTVRWDTGGAGVYLEPSRFNLYQASSLTSSGLAVDLILGGAALLAASGVAILLPVRLKVGPWLLASLSLAVLLLTAGSLAVQRPTPYWTGGLPASVGTLIAVANRGIGLWLSLLGAGLGALSLLELGFPLVRHPHATTDAVDEGAALVGS